MSAEERWAGIDNALAGDHPANTAAGARQWDAADPPDMLAAMRALMATIPPPEEIIARIEAGPVAQAAIRSLATPASPAQPWEPPRYDVPIHKPNPDDPFGHPHGCCWRAINAASGVMREGCVWAEAHAALAYDQGAVALAGAIEGDVGWYVPTGADHCPRCRDINYDPKTRECLTCTNCHCGAAAAGRGTECDEQLNAPAPAANYQIGSD